MNSLFAVEILGHCGHAVFHDTDSAALAVGMLGGWEIVGILVLVLILFGAKKLPELARGLGSGIKEFKKATREVTDEIQSAVNTDHPSSPPPPRKLPPSDETETGQTIARSDESSSSDPKS